MSLLEIDSVAVTAIISAVVAGLIAVIGAIVTGIVVIIQAQTHKRDTDAKLEVIRVDVNSNLTKVQRQLKAALEALNDDRRLKNLPPITSEQLALE